MRKSLFNEDSVTNSNIWWKVEQVHRFDSFSFVKVNSMCNRCNVNITVNYIFRSIQLANMSWWNTLNFGQPFENAIIPSIIKLERIRWFFYQKFNKVIYKEYECLLVRKIQKFLALMRELFDFLVNHHPTLPSISLQGDDALIPYFPPHFPFSFCSINQCSIYIRWISGTKFLNFLAQVKPLF